MEAKNEMDIMPDLNIKRVRLKLLDAAGHALVARSLVPVNDYIRIYLATIPEDHAAYTELKDAVDALQRSSQAEKYNLEGITEKVGQLERRDIMNEGIENILTERMHKALAACWQISLSYSLIDKE